MRPNANAFRHTYSDSHRYGNSVSNSNINYYTDALANLHPAESGFRRHHHFAGSGLGADQPQRGSGSYQLVPG
jgi:hypothetical protein